MAKTPKTLQVSFGSFSCTLEGFDDPVQALRSVTEYVRDLSARDPDFAARLGLTLGAPPPEAPAPEERRPAETAPDLARPPVAAQAPEAPVPEAPVPEAPELAPPAAAAPPPPALDAAHPPVPESPPPVSASPVPASPALASPGPDAPPPAAAGTAPAMPPVVMAPFAVTPFAAPMPPPPSPRMAPDGPGAVDPEEHPGLHLLLSSDPDDDDETIERFLSRADDQLADPEAARRRDVIAQLKAAVAATEAERALGDPEPTPEERQGAFRSDLSDEIRAQAPGIAPLRLVASQRVDEPDEDDLPELAGLAELLADAPPEPPPAPRARTPDSFAGFASEMGAVSLADLIEAAAAWLCFVDEAESVSRAQLLELVAEALPVMPDREEGLRAFGTLLRQGRLSTVAGGRYRISQESRFNPGRLAV